LGSKIEYKSFVRILSNPFYCGYITSILIPDEIHKGNHPPLISTDLFKSVNKKINDNPHHGIPKNGEIIDLPIKAFMKDEISLSPFTGYQQKGIFYCKTRAKGSKVNANANQLNEIFKEELKKFSLEKQLIYRLNEMVLPIVESKFQDQLKWEVSLKKQVAELKTKLNKLHERYIDGDFDKTVYFDFKQKYEVQLREIEVAIAQPNQISSNLEKVVSKGIKLATNPSQLWDTADFKNKQQLQKLVFPEGMFYNKQNNTVRTPRVNSIIALIADQAKVSDKKMMAIF